MGNDLHLMHTKKLTKGPSFATLLAIGLSCVFSACASTNSGTHLGWANEENPASKGVDSAAFHSDAFTFRKEQPDRAPNDFQYYYKNCSLSTEHTFYSKTSYWCTDP